MLNLLRSLAVNLGLRENETLSIKEEKELIEALQSKEDPDSYILKEFHKCKTEEKEGIITSTTGDNFIINNEYYFNPYLSSNGHFSLNDYVKFTVYSNEVETIVKNVEKLDTPQFDISSVDVYDGLEPGTYKFTLFGQVVNRSQRLFKVKLDDIKDIVQFDLDNVKSEYIPCMGDFVELEISSTEPSYVKCKNVTDIKVLKIRPKKTALKMGVVSQWNSNHGSINNFAFFTKDSCQDGFQPGIDQKVLASLVRSDCENGYKWRAIQVVPQSDLMADFSYYREEQKAIEEQLRNKQGISISLPPKFSLKLDSYCDFTLEVTNKSSLEKTMSVHSVSSTEHNQIKLLSPTHKYIPILPHETIEFKFRITGTYVGSSFGEFVWDFSDFKILRKINFEVLCDSMPKSNTDDFFITNSSRKHISAYHIVENSKGDVMPGRRTTGSVFVPVKIGQFLVPKNIIFAALPEMRLNFPDLCIKVEQVLPCLKSGLMPENYKDYMHSLLFLEETELLRKVAQLEIDGASFRKHLDYLILDVPEFSLYTKMFMPGDFALAALPWNKEKKMQGIIHRITKTELWLKFSSNFHFTYQEGSTYTVSFVTSRTPLRRMHQAVDAAMRDLGKKWIFPNAVYSRSPQVYIEEMEQAGCNVRERNGLSYRQDDPNNPFTRDYNDGGRQNNFRGRGKMWNRSGAGCGRYYNVNNYEVSFCTKRVKSINWYNKMLNIQQKKAIVRVLDGEARPLPHVIFGPPGTGKTVTVVEAILQLHHLLPKSRILIITPTNSACDLVAERLLESGNLQEGDFLRLAGVNYLDQGRLTASLIPYSATPSFKGHDGDNETHDSVPSFTREQIAEHRIVVSTLGCIGVLHSMGFPRGYFTHIFIDEAGQTTEPEIMVPMLFLSRKSGQVVLSGDPLQLGPVVFSHLAIKYGLGESFLVRLLGRFPYIKDPEGFPNNFGYDPRLVTKLINNYRSLNGVLQLYSSLFYNNDLVPNICDVTSDESLLLNSIKSLKFNFPVVFHGLQGSNLQEAESKSWYNPQEIFQVFTYLNKFYIAGIKPDQIGIITPYTLQSRKIQTMLEQHNLESPKVGSVEEFQGQEKMIIILSLVKSTEDNDSFVNSSFVTDAKRLNVAISRAQALLVIIGDPELLCTSPNWRRILQYCLSHKSYVGCQLTSSLNSLVKVD